MCNFSVKTTKLTPCCALVRESTLTVREYGFPFSKWSLVPNQGWCFSSFKQKLLPFCEQTCKNQVITDISVDYAQGIYNLYQQMHWLSKDYSGYPHPKWTAYTARSAWYFCVCPNNYFAKLCLIVFKIVKEGLTPGPNYPAILTP
jgi:hypothetical protein